MNREDKIFCLYFHLKKNTDIVFNVGIGDEDRPHDKTSRNFHWHNTVNKYSYDIEIKHTNLTWESACRLEIAWIKKIGRRDKGLGTLVNMTNGGEGVPGRIVSKQEIIKISKKLKKYYETHVNPMKDSKRLDLAEYNRNNKKGIPFVTSASFKKGIAPWNKGKSNYLSFETLIRMRKPKSEKHKKILSERMKKLWRDGRYNRVNEANRRRMMGHKIAQKSEVE